MAKYELEGYCPCNWVPRTWDEDTDSRIEGLWDIIGTSVVYTNDELPCSARCDLIFGKDIISYNVLSSIIRKNANAEKILVHQLYNGSCNSQNMRDIQQVLKTAVNPELILEGGSEFAVVLADTDYGLDIWIWDLSITYL